MQILEAFDLTGSFRAAAELAGCSHHTVARLVAEREAAPSIPAELTDQRAPVWHDAAQFTAWCRCHLGCNEPEGSPVWGPAERATSQWRHGAAAYAWGRRNGFDRYPRLVNTVRLAQDGIRIVAVPERRAG